MPKLSHRAFCILAVYGAVVGTVALGLIAIVVPKLTHTLNKLADLIDRMNTWVN